MVAQCRGTFAAMQGSAQAESLDERFDLKGRSLRQHAARGTLINSAFQVGLAGLGFLRRIIIAAFLTQSEFGIWGILITTLMTLAWLKELGVADKYIQQTDADQELAFQRAFTLELFLSLGFFVLLALVLPIYAIGYGRTEIILPGIVLALSVPISAFESPLWVAYRRMQFVRQRSLSAIDPVTTTLVTIGLGVAGAGYWSLVAGTLAGSVLGAVVAVATCPYPLRIRFSKQTVRSYASFSWPLLGYQMSNLVMVQGLLLVSARTIGVAGVGVIGLASVVSSFADRVDAIVSQSIYPAVCAVADRTELLFEAFLKSNRLALMWGMPFGVGLALFAQDLVKFVIGDEWQSAVAVLAAFGLIAGLRQVAFNWQIFMRAVNRTRPIFVVSLTNLSVFFVVMIPAILIFGLTGYVVASGIAMAVELTARAFFLRRLFPGFRVTRQLARAVLPSVPAAAAVLGVRLIAGSEDTLSAALALVALYVAVTAAGTWLFERSLVVEIGGYLRGRGGQRPPISAGAAATSEA
jgi:O-antigen/teichoic acid export membrane protein